jgi:hypothetical protein
MLMPTWIAKENPHNRWIPSQKKSQIMIWNQSSPAVTLMTGAKCFHFTEKLNSNLLTLIKNYRGPLNCESAENIYIFTQKNSLRSPPPHSCLGYSKNFLQKNTFNFLKKSPKTTHKKEWPLCLGPYNEFKILGEDDFEIGNKIIWRHKKHQGVALVLKEHHLEFLKFSKNKKRAAKTLAPHIYDLKNFGWLNFQISD